MTRSRDISNIFSEGVSPEELLNLDGTTSAIQTQLNSKQSTITGGATTVVSSDLTTSRALVSDGAGKIAVSAITATELGYLDDVTSGIQTQLNAKAPTASPTFTGTITGAPAEPNILSNTTKNIGYVGLPQLVVASGGLTLTKAHAGEHIYLTGSGQTITIPSNASAAFEIGTTIVIINGSSGSNTIAITSDTMRLAGTGATGSRTIAAHGVVTIIKVTSTLWYISGNGLT
jgi:hypothetical protein